MPIDYYDESRYDFTRSTKKRPKKQDPQIPGVDYTYNQYDLTDLFFKDYRYHNEDCMVQFDELSFITNPETGALEKNVLQTSLARFPSFRRMQALRLSSRPFMGNQEIAPQKPNINMGYYEMLLTYVSLPFKTVMGEDELVKIEFNRRLLESITLSDREKIEQKLQAANNPNIFSNKEISDDVGDAFNKLLHTSKNMQATASHIASKMVQDAFTALLHSDVDWTTKPIEALDFVFEPQSCWDTRDWSYFFIIEKMPAQTAVRHIKKKTPYWDTEALKWALNNSVNERGIFRNYRAFNNSRGSDSTPLCGENFMVKSLYADKDRRNMGLSSYYGNLLVVRAFYVTAEGKVQETIFFPSSDFYNIPPERRKDKMSPEKIRENGLEGSDLLFTRTTKFTSINQALTIIPSKRSELSLERQRYYGHEFFNIVEMLMRTDSAILNIISLMGVLFTRNRNEGLSPQNIQDLQVKMTGALQDIGDRDFVDTPLQHDLNAMLAVRAMLWQHAMSKAFLSGLDGAESTGQGRGADFAKYRLVRDGRIHKHDIEDLGKGERELYSKVFRAVLEECKEPESVRDKMVSRLFYDQLIEVHGYSKDILEFDKKDILDDTHLPYWLNIHPLRNGASHMGAAEMVLYSELKQVFGDGLTSQQINNLNRMGFKSVLNASDANDILGDPRDQTVIEQDQVYQASLENAAILGSVDAGVLNFEPIGIKETKDDPIAHLTQVHMPKAQEIIQMLDEGTVTPQEIQEQTDEQLSTRINLILKLSALASHISQHQQQLEFYGSKRPDVNQLKEQVNSVLQSAEGFLNNLQLSLRAQQSKRDEMQLRLQNISPENEAEKMKIESEMQKLQVQREEAQGKLLLANKIADNTMVMHRDKQLTSARDRASKERQAEISSRAKEMDAQSKAAIRQQEMAAKLQEQNVVSSIEQRIKLDEAGLNADLKERDAAFNAALKEQDASSNVARKERETGTKISLQRAESSAKIENSRRESQAKASAMKSNGVSKQ